MGICWFLCLKMITRSGAFNYDTKYKGATSKPLSCIKEDKELSKDGYLINHARVLIGSGFETYEKGKTALQNWKFVPFSSILCFGIYWESKLLLVFFRHFGLDWAFVDPKTPIQNGVKFCVCLKEFLPWVIMPLQVVYVNENTRAKTKKSSASFGFGSGTLQGHLLVSTFFFGWQWLIISMKCFFFPFFLFPLLLIAAY